MSFRRWTGSAVKDAPISDFLYPQTLVASFSDESQPEMEVAADCLREEEDKYTAALASARAAAVAETEARLARDYDAKLSREASKMTEAIARFAEVRQAYFSRVESEVVQLALSIAAKILHRESQVDPFMISAVVQMALSQLKEGSIACLKVHPQNVSRWREHLAQNLPNMSVDVIEDANLAIGDCILETEIGQVNFNVDVQLREIEKGFLDVLAVRP